MWERKLFEITKFELIMRTKASFRTGMHNIWPAGQMWPAEAFNLAREAQNFVYLACFFHEKILYMYKNF